MKPILFELIVDLPIKKKYNENTIKTIIITNFIRTVSTNKGAINNCNVNIHSGINAQV